MGEDKVFAKVAWRIIPFMGLLYLIAFLDRVNVGFAALTMNEDIGLTPEMFGLGAGLFFFIGYFLFEVPSNVILLRVGARIWICRIMLTWGAISMAMALVQGPYSFYALRFLLGLAEAGFAPGMLLYLTFWFPPALRARYMAYYLTAIPLAGVIGAPLSSLILETMPGVAGLAGWQWLFLIEGLPALILGLVVLLYLPNGPEDSKWLTAEEKDGKLALFLSHDGRGDSMRIKSNADIYAATLNGDQSIETVLPEGHGAWIQVARGEVTVNGQKLKTGDGLAIEKGGRLEFTNGDKAEILYFDMWG